MKQILRPFTLLLLAAVVFSSCKKNVPKEAGYIPKEAGFVLSLDPQQLQDKLQKGGISIDTLINRVFKSDSADTKDKAHFNDLRNNAGIDWTGKLFVFMVQKPNSDNSLSNAITVLGSLKDAAKLEAFVKSQNEWKNQQIKKEKDYSYILFEGHAMLSWNDRQIMVTMYSHVQKPVYDTVAMTFKKPTPANTEAEIKAEVARYYTQKPKESMADVDVFSDMFKEKADGYMFSSANSSLAGLSMMPLQIPKLEELLKDNYVTATLSFDDGKVIAKSTSYTNQLLGSILKQYAGPTVNLSMIENYPSKNINAVMLAAFNPEIFGGILKQLEVEGLVNTFMEKAGLSSQDIYKSLKGDIAVVVSDINIDQHEPQFKTDEKSMIKKKPMGKMILTAPVGDKTAFIRVMDKAVEQGILKKQGTSYKAGGLLSFMGMYVIADEKNLTIASDSMTYIQYITKAEKAEMNKEVLDRFKGKSTVFYFDIAGTLNGFSKDVTANYQQSLQTAKTTFKDVLASSDNYDGKNIKAQVELRMQNEKQNSLVTLVSLITDIAVDMRVQSRREREMEDKLFPGGVPAIIRTN